MNKNVHINKDLMYLMLSFVQYIEDQLKYVPKQYMNLLNDCIQVIQRLMMLEEYLKKEEEEEE
jgi:hypothetical protein